MEVIPWQKLLNKSLHWFGFVKFIVDAMKIFKFSSGYTALWGCLFYKGLECERPSRVAWWTLFTHMTATLILSWEWELKRRRESRADGIWGKGGLGTAGGMCSLFPHFCWYRKESKNRQYTLSECPPHFWTFRRPWIVVDGSRMGGRKSVLNTTCWKI